jgi:hypothetical protein
MRFEGHKKYWGVVPVGLQEATKQGWVDEPHRESGRLRGEHTQCKRMREPSTDEKSHRLRRPRHLRVVVDQKKSAIRLEGHKILGLWRGCIHKKH